jgi:hypothetical protein
MTSPALPVPLRSADDRLRSSGGWIHFPVSSHRHSVNLPFCRTSQYGAVSGSGIGTGGSSAGFVMASPGCTRSRRRTDHRPR